MRKSFAYLILNSWWVVLFPLLCYMAYENGIRKTRGQYETLKKQFDILQKDRDSSLELQQNFILKINAQSDPAWIELTLMEKLGLVPEGQTKFFFKSERS